MDTISTTLSDVQLATLREAYSREQMTQILSSGMPSSYEPTTAYIDAIRTAFYDRTQEMAPKDRERCLIAILVSRDAGLNLALHIYHGLMVGLTPKEIADVIFLGGIYTGVDRISEGFFAATRVLTVLALLVGNSSSNDCAVIQVVRALQREFRPPLPTSLPPAQ
jgi:alkylhydroperoxidase/carboxymuconolactone decarboxylase family protein YurZ